MKSGATPEGQLGGLSRLGGPFEPMKRDSCRKYVDIVDIL